MSTSPISASSSAASQCAAVAPTLPAPTIVTLFRTVAPFQYVLPKVIAGFGQTRESCSGMNTTLTSPASQAGLRGAVVGDTRLSSINGEEGKLIYRGIDIHDLARHSTFEEITYLLWFGALPSRAHLDEFRERLNRCRALPPQLLALLRDLPKNGSPMDALRTAVSALGLFDPDVNATSYDSQIEKAV